MKNENDTENKDIQVFIQMLVTQIKNSKLNSNDVLEMLEAKIK